MTTKSDLWTHDLPEGAPFVDFVKLAFSRLHTWYRENIIYELYRNDSNGVWADADNIREFGKVITKAEAIQHFASMLGEFGGIPKDWNILNEEELEKL
jgi:hypothetical protein